MKSILSKVLFGLAVGVAAVTLAAPLHARDPGINQPGAIGNTGPARRSGRR
jgi:hypothetical protein